MFAKLKAILRKAAERSLATLWKRIAESLNAFTLQEYANCFIADGYIPA